MSAALLMILFTLIITWLGYRIDYKFDQSEIKYYRDLSKQRLDHYFDLVDRHQNLWDRFHELGKHIDKLAKEEENP